MSSRSEVCRACFAPRTGDGLRLRWRELEDMAKDGTLRKADFRDEVRTSGDPIETCGDIRLPSVECRLSAFRSTSNDEELDCRPSDICSSGGFISSPCRLTCRWGFICCHPKLAIISS